MYYFKYLNPVRDEEGKLRNWSDHRLICEIENRIDMPTMHSVDAAINRKHEFINERSKIQNGIQKVR